MNQEQKLFQKKVTVIIGLIILTGISVLSLLHICREKRIPIEPDKIETIRNIWIMEVEENRICCFYKDAEVWYDMEETLEADSHWREQVADLTLCNDRLQKVKIKQEKTSGKLLEVTEQGVSIEGLGTYPFAQEYAIYRLYDKLATCSKEDLRIGYAFTDFVIEEGKICACLMARDEAMEKIRVLIKQQGIFHDKVTLQADTDMKIRYVDEQTGSFAEEVYEAGTVVDIEENSPFWNDVQGGNRIYIEPVALTGRVLLQSVQKNQGIPSYRGTLEVVKQTEGMVIINEVLLEEYLYSVVPSEMPASYPLEALKAQAICARTYAYGHMMHAGLKQYGAHVDDSAAYQVYNNVQEHAQTTKAVLETGGQLLYYEGAPAGTYYYSTSCGYGTDTRIWKSESMQEVPYIQAKAICEKEEAAETMSAETAGYTKEDMQEENIFEEFIAGSNAKDFEHEESWYRWTYTVAELDVEEMTNIIKSRYQANPKLVLRQNKAGNFVSESIEDLGQIRNLYVAKRNAGGVIDELIVEGTKETVKVITEHNVRYVLKQNDVKVKRQDGSEVSAGSLLPSAFFIIRPSQDGEDMIGYTLIGGGFGHGAGMSQNGAKSMAAKGYTCEDILQFFYEGSELVQVYGREE